MDDLLFADELADALRRSRGYIYAMKAAGFTMPGGTATVTEAREWLRSHPEFSSTSYYKRGAAAAEGLPPLEVNFN